MSTPEDNKALVRQFMEEVFNNKNLDWAEDHLADGFIEHNPLTPDMPHDKKGALEGFKAMQEMSSDAQVEILDR